MNTRGRIIVVIFAGFISVIAVEREFIPARLLHYLAIPAGLWIGKSMIRGLGRDNTREAQTPSHAPSPAIPLGRGSEREGVVDTPIDGREDYQYSFPWPTTDTIDGGGDLSAEAWPQQGLLSYVGYRVGQNGLDASVRRVILNNVYDHQLPNVNDAEYMASWGPPATATRLRKMAESIAAFCRNQKRKDTYSTAVDEWESDLDYLKQRYYVNRYDFAWPSSEAN